MSVKELSLSKKSFNRPSPASLPRVALFLSERVSSNCDNQSTDVSTPLLPKNPWGKSKDSSSKKSKLSDCQGEQVSQITLLEVPVSRYEQENVEPLDLSSPIASSSCGDDSPYRKNFKKSPQRKQQKNQFNETFYKRIEEFLDAEHLNICQPEENRRAMFLNLKISTAKTGSLTGSDSAVVSEFNSPTFLSPCIKSSSLIQRRSTSRESSAERVTSNKKALVKSPFFNFAQRGEEQLQQICIKEIEAKGDLSHREEISPMRKPNQKICALGMKLQGLARCENLNPDVVKVLNLDEEI